jgi:hypothetical protein
LAERRWGKASSLKLATGSSFFTVLYDTDGFSERTKPSPPYIASDDFGSGKATGMLERRHRV